MFNVKQSKTGQGLDVENPMVGNWIPTSPDEGYVCTTGHPFRIPGTSNPLHIRRAAGDMPVEHCLSDVFSLSCLTWTRPEGATRLPISIKLCDRILFDEAAEYDQDAIEFENRRQSSGGYNMSDLSLLTGVYVNVEAYGTLIDRVIQQLGQGRADPTDPDQKRLAQTPR